MSSNHYNNRKKNTSVNNISQKTGGFIGFAAFSTTSNNVSKNENTFPGKKANTTIQFYEGPDAELKLIFRRLSKKDATTNIKALNELHLLIQQRKPIELKPAISHWIYLYNKIILKNDKRTRLEANRVMGEWFLKMKKIHNELLHQFIESWWFSMHEFSSPDVSSIALKYFEEIFNTKKLQHQLFQSCCSQILTKITEYIKSDEKSFSETTSDKEDSIEKYHRCVSCALFSFASLIKRSQEDKENNFEMDLTPFFSKDVWNLMHSKYILIRRSIYHVAYEIFACPKYLSLMIQEWQDNTKEKEMCNILCHCLNEKDPSNHSSMWDCFLCILKTYPHLWHHVEEERIIFPRLFSLIRHGFYGSASVSYPLCLPLMSMIPVTVVKHNNRKKFIGHIYLRFLEEIWISLDNSFILGNVVPLVFQTYGECLTAIFTILSNACFYNINNETNEIDSFIDNMLEYGVFVPFKEILFSQKSKAMGFELVYFEQLIDVWILIQKFAKKHQEKSQQFGVQTKAEDLFWLKLEKLMDESLNSKEYNFKNYQHLMKQMNSFMTVLNSKEYISNLENGINGQKWLKSCFHIFLNKLKKMMKMNEKEEKKQEEVEEEIIFFSGQCALISSLFTLEIIYPSSNHLYELYCSELFPLMNSSILLNFIKKNKILLIESMFIMILDCFQSFQFDRNKCMEIWDQTICFIHGNEIAYWKGINDYENELKPLIIFLDKIVQKIEMKKNLMFIKENMDIFRKNDFYEIISFLWTQFNLFSIPVQEQFFYLIQLIIQSNHHHHICYLSNDQWIQLFSWTTFHHSMDMRMIIPQLKLFHLLLPIFFHPFPNSLYETCSSQINKQILDCLLLATDTFEKINSSLLIKQEAWNCWKDGILPLLKHWCNDDDNNDNNNNNNLFRYHHIHQQIQNHLINSLNHSIRASQWAELCREMFIVDSLKRKNRKKKDDPSSSLLLYFNLSSLPMYNLNNWKLSNSNIDYVEKNNSTKEKIIHYLFCLGELFHLANDCIEIKIHHLDCIETKKILSYEWIFYVLYHDIAFTFSHLIIDTCNSSLNHDLWNGNINHFLDWISSHLMCRSFYAWIFHSSAFQDFILMQLDQLNEISIHNSFFSIEEKKNYNNEKNLNLFLITLLIAFKIGKENKKDGDDEEKMIQENGKDDEKEIIYCKLWLNQLWNNSSPSRYLRICLFNSLNEINKNKKNYFPLFFQLWIKKIKEEDEKIHLQTSGLSMIVDMLECSFTNWLIEDIKDLIDQLLDILQDNKKKNHCMDVEEWRILLQLCRVILMKKPKDNHQNNNPTDFILLSRLIVPVIQMIFDQNTKIQSLSSISFKSSKINPKSFYSIFLLRIELIELWKEILLNIIMIHKKKEFIQLNDEFHKKYHQQWMIQCFLSFYYDCLMIKSFLIDDGFIFLSSSISEMDQFYYTQIFYHIELILPSCKFILNSMCRDNNEIIENKRLFLAMNAILGHNNHNNNNDSSSFLLNEDDLIMDLIVKQSIPFQHQMSWYQLWNYIFPYERMTKIQYEKNEFNLQEQLKFVEKILPLSLREGMKQIHNLWSSSSCKNKKEENIFLYYLMFTKYFGEPLEEDKKIDVMLHEAFADFLMEQDNNLFFSFMNICCEYLVVKKINNRRQSFQKIKNLHLPLIMNQKDSFEYDFDDKDEKSILLLDQLVMISFFRMIYHLPTLSRRWWVEECSRNQSMLISSFVEDHLSPYLMELEVNKIQQAMLKKEWDIDEMLVKGSRVSREITTCYYKDDCSIELVIVVPKNYPFNSIQIECKKRLGVNEETWHRWILQLIQTTNYGMCAGDNILNAIRVWKKNLDQQFEGVEPCPICYSILNPANFSLPNLTCKICKQKYHNSCLYKWFHQSGKNKCPICQQPMCY